MASSLILKELISELNLSVYAFERKIGVGASAIQKAIERESAMKEDTIQKILKTFPLVSRHWLMFGEGEMFLISNKLKNDVNNNESDTNNVSKHKYGETHDFVNDNSLTSSFTNLKDDENMAGKSQLDLLILASYNNSIAKKYSDEAHLVNARNIESLIELMKGSRVPEEAKKVPANK